MTPHRKRAEERRLEVLELARSGLYASEIARRTKSQPQRVAALCREAGVELQSGVSTTPEMEAAVQLVASGMAVVDAAHAAARRVLAGERICDAAMAEQCTPSSAWSTLRRLRAINAGSREP